MANEMPAGPATTRPRPWLLVALAVTIVVALALWFWPANPAGPGARPSNAPRPAAGGATDAVDPAALDVRLDALEARRDVEQNGERNPFRFQPRPAPAPPPVDIRPVPERPLEPETPSVPPPPPPIPLKFIGVIEPRAGDRVAVFTDCRITPHAREGDIVVGQYRLVRIGVESVVMEYLDGRGRTTIRQSGQDCVGK